MPTAVLGWPPDLLLYITVGTRLLLGLLLFFAAPSCRLPRFTRVIDVIAIVSGIVSALIGASRLESIRSMDSGEAERDHSAVIWVRYCFGRAHRVFRFQNPKGEAHLTVESTMSVTARPGCQRIRVFG